MPLLLAPLTATGDAKAPKRMTMKRDDDKVPVGSSMWTIQDVVLSEGPELTSKQVGFLVAGAVVKLVSSKTLDDGTVRVGIDSTHDNSTSTDAWLTYSTIRRAKTSKGHVYDVWTEFFLTNQRGLSCYKLLIAHYMALMGYIGATGVVALATIDPAASWPIILLLGSPLLMLHVYFWNHHSRIRHFDRTHFAPGAKVHRPGILFGEDGYVVQFDPADHRSVLVDFSHLGGKVHSIRISSLQPIDPLLERGTSTVRHSTNARMALYTLSVCMLVKSCVSTLIFTWQPELSLQASNQCTGTSYGTGITTGNVLCYDCSDDECKSECLEKGHCPVNVWTLDANPEITIPFMWNVCEDITDPAQCLDSISSLSEAAEVAQEGSKFQIEARFRFLIASWIFAVVCCFFYVLYWPIHLMWRLLKYGPALRNNKEVLEENGWVLLKYQPSSWWFEFVLIYHKIIVITASEKLNSGTKADTHTLLRVLCVSTVLLILIVAVRKPFRDSEGTTGLTEADKSELISLLCYLGELGVGWICLQVREDRQSNRLTKPEESMVTVITLFFVGFPLIQMLNSVIHHRLKRRSRKRKLRGAIGTIAASQSAIQAFSNAKASDIDVIFHNPLLNESQEDERVGDLD